MKSALFSYLFALTDSDPPYIKSPLRDSRITEPEHADSQTPALLFYPFLH
ncbi:hypothetical protein ADIAL_0187 [Alkalibacterium sp. AK22]|nr:hypothetical protein ADIAL_0187 [Alkalibacterium sp. AK22]